TNQEGSPSGFQELQPQRAAPYKSKKKQKSQQPVAEANQPAELQQPPQQSSNQLEQQEQGHENTGQQESAPAQAVSSEQPEEAAEGRIQPVESPDRQPPSIEDADNCAGEEDARSGPFEAAV
ncbi:hypothetical protein KEM55_002576, partial [Ascosphaera atra]